LTLRPPNQLGAAARRKKKEEKGGEGKKKGEGKKTISLPRFSPVAFSLWMTRIDWAGDASSVSDRGKKEAREGRKKKKKEK